MRRIRVFDGQNSVPLCRRRISLAKSGGRLGGTARAGGRFAANRRRSQPAPEGKEPGLESDNSSGRWQSVRLGVSKRQAGWLRWLIWSHTPVFVGTCAARGLHLRRRRDRLCR